MSCSRPRLIQTACRPLAGRPTEAQLGICHANHGAAYRLIHLLNITANVYFKTALLSRASKWKVSLLKPFDLRFRASSGGLNQKGPDERRKIKESDHDAFHFFAV